MRELTLRELLMAQELAARHHIPETDVRHPPGVIVPNDALLTRNIKDPNYVPYCGPCTPCQRLRRVPEGFMCPRCGNKSNWDLTKFDDNKNVKFEAGYEAPKPMPAPVPTKERWNANVLIKKREREHRRAQLKLLKRV